MIRKSTAVEKITVGKLARGMKDEIVNWLLSLAERSLEGNLARSMKLDLKNITHEECIWASDFQTYNPRCPNRVRVWLVKNYRARFRKTN
jgi:hypothetical protein